MDAVTSPQGGLAVWEIVRVEFPYADEATSRRRPALMVAVPEVHDQSGIVWVLMITNARQGSRPFDGPVSDLHRTGLSHACAVWVAKVAVLDARLAERIGVLGVEDRDAVRVNMLNLLIGGLGRT